MDKSELKSLIKQSLIEEGISVTPEGKVDYNFAKNRDEDVLWFTKLNKEPNIQRFTKTIPIDIFYGFVYRKVEDIAKTTHLGTSLKKTEKNIENEIRIVRSELKHFKTPEAEKAVSWLLDYALDEFEKTHPLDSFNLIISPRSSGEINGMIYSKIKKRLKGSNTVLGFDHFVKNTISKMIVLYDKIETIKNPKTKEYVTSVIDDYLKNPDDEISLSKLDKSVQQYITNVFKFSNEEDVLKIGLAIRGGKILIVDDSFSEGKTLDEIRKKLLELDEPIGATFVAWVPFRNYRGDKVVDKNQERNRIHAIVKSASASDEEKANSLKRLKDRFNPYVNRLRGRNSKKTLAYKSRASSYNEKEETKLFKKLRSGIGTIKNYYIPPKIKALEKLKNRFLDTKYLDLYNKTLELLNGIQSDIKNYGDKTESDKIKKIDDPNTKGISFKNRKRSFSEEELKEILSNLESKRDIIDTNMEELKTYGMGQEEKVSYIRVRCGRRIRNSRALVKEWEKELESISDSPNYDDKKRVEQLRNELIPNGLKRLELYKKELSEFDRIHGTGARKRETQQPVSESLSLRSILKNILEENIDAFKQDMDSDMRGKILSVKHSDYAEGDELYTITGAPVTFISDLLPDKKNKNAQRVMVKLKDGSTSSMYLKHLLPERPSKEQALSFMASKYKTYEEFVDASTRRGYDESDNLKQIWDNSRNT